MSSSSAYVPMASNHNNRKVKGRKYNNPTREQIQHAKNCLPCKRWSNHGHWFGDHNEDESLPDIVPNSNTPLAPSKSKPRPAEVNYAAMVENAPRILKFNSATTLNSLNGTADSNVNQHSWLNNIGPFVDSGAPYSTIGIVELALVAAAVLPKWNGNLD